MSFKDFLVISKMIVVIAFSWRTVFPMVTLEFTFKVEILILLARGVSHLYLVVN